MELWLTVNGKRTCASAPLDPLTRAVVISLFMADSILKIWKRGAPASLSGITGRLRAGLMGTMLSGLKKCPALPVHGHTATGWERGLSV